MFLYIFRTVIYRSAPRFIILYCDTCGSTSKLYVSQQVFAIFKKPSSPPPYRCKQSRSFVLLVVTTVRTVPGTFLPNMRLFPFATAASLLLASLL